MDETLTSAELARFVVKIDQRSPDECWPWLAGKSTRGYGIFHAGGRQRLAHRIAFVLAGGEIPDGFTIDHECHTRDESCSGGDDCPHRACCNPGHHAAVSRGENSVRGLGPSGANARKTHCPRGHEYDLVSGGRRRCLRCKRERYAERRAAA